MQRQGRTRHLYYILIIYSAISVQVLVLPDAPARKVPGEVRHYGESFYVCNINPPQITKSVAVFLLLRLQTSPIP